MIGILPKIYTHLTSLGEILPILFKDTTGNKRFTALIRRYLKDADFVFYICDLASPDALKHLSNIKAAYAPLPSKTQPIVIGLNSKTDAIDATIGEIDGIPFFEINLEHPKSNNQGCDALFNYVAEQTISHDNARLRLPSRSDSHGQFLVLKRHILSQLKALIKKEKSLGKQFTTTFLGANKARRSRVRALKDLVQRIEHISPASLSIEGIHELFISKNGELNRLLDPLIAYLDSFIQNNAKPLPSYLSNSM